MINESDLSGLDQGSRESVELALIAIARSGVLQRTIIRRQLEVVQQLGDSSTEKIVREIQLLHHETRVMQGIHVFSTMLAKKKGLTI